MSSWTCTCGHSERLTDKPESFRSRILSASDEEAGLAEAAKDVRSFFAARGNGADSEIEWLRSYFERPGFESFSDEDLIEMIIERNLFAGTRTMIECPSCSKIFVELPGSSEVTQFIPEQSPLNANTNKKAEQASAPDASPGGSFQR